jgi:hypothetical protein
MSGQTLLIKSDPREGVKKNLSEISEKKDVWPLGGIGMNRKSQARKFG